MVKFALHHGKQKGQNEKNTSGVFRDLGKDRSRTRSKQGIRRASAEREAGAGVLFRKLNQHQEDQDQAVQHHHERQ